jgi:putative redox protein
VRGRSLELGDAQDDDYAIEVTPLAYAAGDAYIVAASGHRWIVDQPREEGGSGLGATPADTVIGGLASCIASHAGRYLTSHRIGRDGLRVLVNYLEDEDPARVGAVQIRIILPPSFPDKQKDELIAAIGDCRAHSCFFEAPGIGMEIILPGDDE